VLEFLLVGHHALHHPVAVQCVQHTRLHHGRGPPPVRSRDHPERPARGIPRAHVPVHRVGDAGEVRALGEVVAPTAGPHQHVVGEVPGDAVSLRGGVGEGAGEEGDVFVVPRVAVGDGGAVGEAGDLVAVVPPGEDAGVLGGVLLEVPVGFAVVVNAVPSARPASALMPGPTRIISRIILELK